MKIHVLILALLTIVVSGCFKERIELDYNGENNKKVVITGWLTDLAKPQYISVSNTVSYLGEIAEDQVSDAMVTIQTDGEEYILEEQSKGKYFLPEDWKPLLGNTYSLTVVVDDKTYTSTHIMRSCPTIDNPQFYKVDEQDSTGIQEFETVFGFQETPGEGDAYYAIDYKKGDIAGDSLVNGGFANDDFVDGEYFDDIFISDSERFFVQGDTTIIELYSVGKETANFLQDINNEIFRGGPFDAPPANVRSNIEGGAIGYFIISGAKQVAIVVE